MSLDSGTSMEVVVDGEHKDASKDAINVKDPPKPSYSVIVYFGSNYGNYVPGLRHPCNLLWSIDNVNIDGSTAVVTLGMTCRANREPHNNERVIKTSHSVTKLRVESEFAPSDIVFKGGFIETELYESGMTVFRIITGKIELEVDFKYKSRIWRMEKIAEVAEEIYDEFKRVSKLGMPYLTHSIRLPESWIDQSIKKEVYEDHILRKAFSVLEKMGLCIRKLESIDGKVTRVHVSV